MAGCRSFTAIGEWAADIQLDRTFTGCCLVTLDEDGALTLCETLTEWLR